MSFFSPQSIAVIGASPHEGKVGHAIIKNLVTQGYSGELYPVNPNASEILGKACFPSVSQIPTVPEMAIVVTPAKSVPALAQECGEKGIRSLIVISAGFSELGTEEGKALEAELRAVVQQHTMRMIGPNCLGILRPSMGMNASFAASLPPKGSIALVSQSGALAVALLDAAPALHIGFSFVASIGNKADIDECAVLEMLAKDPETKVIGFYLENVHDGREFLSTAAKVSVEKPIVLLKAGTTDAGRRAAASHTGALAGADGAIDALCTQAGILRARTLEECTDMLSILASEPPLPTPNIAVITNAGGPGILAADAANTLGLSLRPLSPTHAESLAEALPSAASVHNPIDVLGDADAVRYRAALDTCAKDPEIDGIAVLLTPQVMTPAAAVAENIVAIKKRIPLMPITVSFMGGERVAVARAILDEGGIPHFASPERAVRALACLHTRALHQKQTRNFPKPATQVQPTERSAKAIQLMGNVQGLLPENTTKAILALYGLPQPAADLATNVEEAVTIAERIGYPVIAKVSSPEIIHKVDVGGVAANLKNAAEVRSAYASIQTNIRTLAPEACLRGILIQRFLPAGEEFIVGGLRDPAFGPMVMVGLGGIYTELFRDAVFRLAPIDEGEAYAMLQTLRSWKLLLGLRGKACADIPALAAALVGVSQCMEECKHIAACDCNPVFVRPEGISIADAKILRESNY
jgi:acetyltransferase